MVCPNSFEELTARIASLGKAEVMYRLLHFKGRPRLDFTESYLASLNVDKLRHILVAARLATPR